MTEAITGAPGPQDAGARGLKLSPPRQTAIIAWHEIVDSVTSLRVLFALGVFALVTVGLGSRWIDLEIELTRRLQDNLSLMGLGNAVISKEVILKSFKQALEHEGTVKSGDWILDLFRFLAGHPAPLAIILMYAVQVIAAPFVLLFMAYDVIAQDLSQRTLRFLLLRTGRWEIYLGKLAAQASLFAVVALFNTLAVLGLGVLRIEHFAGPGAILQTFLLWLYVVLASLPALALIQLVSTLVARPFQALAASGLVLMGMLFLGLFKPFKFVLPGGYVWRLLQIDAGVVVVAAAALLALFAAWTAVGGMAFNRREL